MAFNFFKKKKPTQQQTDRKSSASDLKDEPKKQEPSENGTKKDVDEDEYADYLQKVKKLEMKDTDIIQYIDIIKEDDETSKKEASKATDEQIQKELDWLIGPKKEWSTESDEVQQFREYIRNVRKKSLELSSSNKPKERTLPPVYVSSEPPPPGTKETFYCKVHLKNMKKTVACDAKMNAEEFAQYFIEKINATHAMDKKAEDWIFKATGTAEYLYGKHRMIDFEHIRRCLKRGERVELNLMDKQEVLDSTDQTVNVLKHVSYDFLNPGSQQVTFNHDKLKFEANSWDNMQYISMWDLHKPFRVKVIGIDNVELILPPRKKHEKKKPHPVDPANSTLYLVVEIFHGGTVIGKARTTRPVFFSPNPRWNQWIEFPDLFVADLPRESRISFTLYGSKFKQQDLELSEAVYQPSDYALEWVNFQLINYKGILYTGPANMGMWPNGSAKPTGQTNENLGEPENKRFPAKLQVEFEKYNFPVVFPTQGNIPPKTKERFDKFLEKQRQKFPEIPREDLLKVLNNVVKTDPLYQLSEEEKWRIWEAREELKNDPHALSKFLLSVNWGNPCAVKIAHEMLSKWTPLDPVDCLELLDYNYADLKVRTYAIKRLDELEDNMLDDYVLQLVQTLKYESYHDTALSRFLLQRAIRSTHLIGHILFWHLKAEMHVTHIRERHGLLLEEYLSTCGGHRRELLKQNGVVNQLLAIAMLIKKTKKGEEQVKVLREQLQHLVLPPKFKLPLNPRMEVKGVIPAKCKVMDSAKFPLWIVFENADETGSPIHIIFKAGDDLRQDLLTLQILRLMDKLWKMEGLDLHMQPYGCITTGDGVGMIEVVLNANTIANVTHEYGGASAALSKEPLVVWLRKQNPKPGDWDTVVNNFVLSCAGYCVATYVLGIGDRHNDNIMLTVRGDLFHIDFGHFLGHFKKFHGISRETTPFVFDQMYAAVMGGPEGQAFKKFSELCAKAYNIVRRHGNLLITLFLLMLATGIPELTGVHDVMWLHNCLKKELTDEQASEHFQKLIHLSLTNIRIKVNNVVHIVAHKNL